MRKLNRLQPFNDVIDPILQPAAKSSQSAALSEYEDKFKQLTRLDTVGESVGGCGFGMAIYFILAFFILSTKEFSFLFGILGWPFMAIFGFLLGMFVALFATVLVVPVNASLGWPMSSLTESFVIGGVTGFMPTFFVLMLLGAWSEDMFDLSLIVATPAMVLCHLCAFWSARKVVREHNRRFGVMKHDERIFDQNLVRFNISQIMILTVWVALAFALISLLPPDVGGFLAKVYFIAQAAAGLSAFVIIVLTEVFVRHRRRNRTSV